MIRRFNYTQRIRISRKDIRIALRKENGNFSFDADLSALGKYGLPQESNVFVEAYRQASWVRFNFGTVGAITPDKKCDLSQFESPEGLLFRVKVTPNGDLHKLLAEADHIPLVQPEQIEGEREPLLHVKPQKLGDEIFRLDFSGDRPLLLVNSDAGNFYEISRSPAFMALVYPNVFREILNRVLLIEKHEEGDSDDWKSQWVKFALSHPGLGGLPETEDVFERIEWIDRVVSAFAKTLGARTKFAEFWDGAK